MLVPSPIHVFSWLAESSLSDVLQGGAPILKDMPFCPEQFDVHPKSGFFPAQPLQRLPQEFDCWESHLDRARQVVKLSEDRSPAALAMAPHGESWRNTVRQWSIKSIERLQNDLRLLQRAHMVLGSLMHFYVHSLPQTAAPIVVPRSIAVPLVQVSRLLRIAPVLTFADVVLWNWEFIDPSSPLSVSNMRYPYTFSGTETEENFYLSSAAVELKGVEMLEIFQRFMKLQGVSTDLYAISTISRDLHTLAGIIDDLTAIFQSIRETVNPHNFYWMVRPWWSGSSSERNWVLEGVPESAQLDLGGASAGQSSVMHALDIFLDIDHKLETARTPAPSANNRGADRGFMERMRRYMPGPHREYLERLRPVRAVVEEHAALREPYNATVLALKRLRDVHFRVVALYVITQKGSTRPAGFVQAESSTAQRATGTGGSEVSTLLRAGRDATERAMLRGDR